MRLKRKSHFGAQYRALFDVGATSIGACIVDCGSAERNILWQTRTAYAYGAYDEYVRYERAMYSALLEVGMKLMSEGAKSVQEEHSAFALKDMKLSCVLAPPWFFGGVQKVAHTSEKPFEVTDGLRAELQNRAIDTLTQRQECVSWQEVVGKATLLSHQLQSTQLEGYEIKDCAHKLVHEATLTSYYALVGASIFKQVHEILERVLPTQPLSFTTSTELLTQLYRRSIYNKKHSGITLIEAEGQVTSIASIREGKLTHVRTIPFGTNKLLQAVAPKAVNAKEAHGKLLLLIKTTEKGEGEKKVYPKALQESLDVWYKAVQDELRIQSDGITPPTQILLMVGAHWHQLLSSALSQPWEVPGIREMIPMQVQPFYTLTMSQKDTENKAKIPKDTRLKVLTGALQTCNK